MNKCVRCGKEFEGNFCPECGENQRDTLTCPQCGAQAKTTDNYCPQCGRPYFFDTLENKNVSSPSRHTSKPETLYAVFYILPALLFALFAICLFGIFAAPIAVIPSQEIFGEVIPSESCGNVYSLYGKSILEIINVSGETAALLVFSVLSFFLALIVLVNIFTPISTILDVKFAGTLRIKIYDLLFYAMLGFYLCFLVIGAVLAAKINVYQELISSGTCPVLLLILSIVFGLITAGTKIAKVIFKDKFAPLLNKERAMRAALAKLPASSYNDVFPEGSSNFFVWVKEHTFTFVLLSLLVIIVAILAFVLPVAI